MEYKRQSWDMQNIKCAGSRIVQTELAFYLLLFITFFNCRRLTNGSFQLTHMSRDDHAVQFLSIDQVRASHGGQTEDKTLQRSQPCHKGEFWHVSISARQWSVRCGQNLCGPFLRATLAMTVGSCAPAMADIGETKGLILPSRWTSAQLLYVWVTAW